MVREYIKKNTRLNYTPGQMSLALKAVIEDGKTCRSAALEFGVPRSTLSKKVQAHKSSLRHNQNKEKGFARTFTDEQEEKLARYITNMECHFIGLSGKDVRKLAFDLAEKLEIDHKFNSKEGLAGVDWLRNFMKRHNLSHRKAEHTSAARINGFNEDAVNEFFVLLKQVLDTHKIPPSRIFNVDETGISAVPKNSPRVITKRGKRQVNGKTQSDRGETVTAELCMSATGEFMPPMLIFPRANKNEEMLKGKPFGAWGEFHVSGYMQTHLFTKWFKKFIEFSETTIENPVLLLCDGHSTHVKNLEVIELARENGVIILCFPPHTTHKLQPLDVGLMAPLNVCLGQEISRLQQKGKTVNLKNLFQVFGEAFKEAAKVETAVSAFRKCGVCPYNPGVFTKADFSDSIDDGHSSLSEIEKEEFEKNVSHFTKMIEEIRNDKSHSDECLNKRGPVNSHSSNNIIKTNEDELILVPKSLILPLYEYLSRQLEINDENSPVSLDNTDTNVKAPSKTKTRGKAVIITDDEYRSNLIAYKIKNMKIEPCEGEDVTSSTFVREVLLCDPKVPKKKKTEVTKRKALGVKNCVPNFENVVNNVLSTSSQQDAVLLDPLNVGESSEPKRKRIRAPAARPKLKKTIDLLPVPSQVKPNTSGVETAYQVSPFGLSDLENIPILKELRPDQNNKCYVEVDGILYEILNNVNVEKNC